MVVADGWRSQSAPSLQDLSRQKGNLLMLPHEKEQLRMDTEAAERMAVSERVAAEAQMARDTQHQMRQTMREHLNRQLAEKSHLPELVRNEKEQARQENEAVVAQLAEEAKKHQETAHQTMRSIKDGLDQQLAQNAQLNQESRAREKKAELERQHRLMQQLTEDMVEQERKRKTLRKVNEQVKRAMDAKARGAKERHSAMLREGEDFKRALEREAQNHADRLVADKERMKAMSAQLDYRQKVAAPFFEEERQRKEREIARWDKDAQLHTQRLDQHYARRESARVRLNHGMSQTLDHQMDFTQKQKEMGQLEKRADLHAVNQSTRAHLEHELETVQKKKVAQKTLQHALLQQIVEKSNRPRSSGPHAKMPPNLKTMAPTSSMLAIATSPAPTLGTGFGAKAGTDELHQRLDASKHLTKPLGRPMERPSSQVDLHRSTGFGGVVGCFGGEGAFRPAFAATKGATQQLASHTHIARRDKNLRATWSQGLSKDELRSGLRAAAQRGAAFAADKSIVDPIIGPPAY
jgi:hypothetical protein